MKYSKAQLFDFAVLVLRWYLVYYMIDYGWAKLSGTQFGIYDASVLDKPLKDVDKFYLAWHLFSLDRTFDISVGVIQILCAVLLIYNRTVLIGALLVLPVLIQIFFVDLSFTTNIFGYALPVRLFGMILSDLLILFYYKERVISACQKLTQGTTTKFRYRWWVFVLLPLLGLATDFVIGVLLYPVRLLLNWMFI